MINNNKIILGTAQFIPSYGISNKRNIVEMNNIIDQAIESGINLLDTAPAYGKAESALGSIRREHQVITKFPKFDKNKEDFIHFLEKSIQSSLSRLKRSKIEYILFHDFESFIENFDQDLLNFLEDLKDNKVIGKLGFSVYSVEEVHLLFDLLSFDVLQFPLNPFNQKFMQDDFLKKLKSMNIETHARSVFLQGLLLSMNGSINLKSHEKMQPFLIKWFSEVKKSFNSPIDACLEFINQVDCLDKYLVGVTSTNELKQILNFQSQSKKFNFSQFDNNDKLFDPRFWV